MSKDRHLIAFHDSTLDRTTDTVGKVNEKTLEELKKLDAGSWFSEDFKGENIITLHEIFQRYGNDVNFCDTVKI